MPSGIPVASMAIDGAKNAALYSISILALTDQGLSQKLKDFRKQQEKAVLDIEI
jgi:5-(carboxyamino)imidazole ribonucleotide mutase